ALRPLRSARGFHCIHCYLVHCRHGALGNCGLHKLRCVLFLSWVGRGRELARRCKSHCRVVSAKRACLGYGHLQWRRLDGRRDCSASCRPLSRSSRRLAFVVPHHRRAWVYLAHCMACRLPPLDRHPYVSDEERHYIQEGQTSIPSSSPPPLRALLSLRETWSILVARFLVDPVWWLYILWLPTYLKDVRHFSLKDIGISAWVPYLAAAIGSLFGGWLAGRMIARGASVNAARKWTTGIAAC